MKSLNRSSTPSATGLAAAAVLAALLSMPGPTRAAAGAVTPFISVSPVYQGSADLDRGGDFSMTGAIIRGGFNKDLGGGNRVGLTLNYDYYDYSFSNPVAFGGNAPWGTVQRYGVSAPMAFNMGNGWTAGFTPSVDWVHENDAKTSDSMIWGAVFSGVKRFDDGNVLGFGLGVFDRIEQTKAFPFVIVNWKLADRWRLINPLPSGPLGAAGLELDYLVNSDWTVGFGVTSRRTRFRLSENGPVRNGIGEERGVPVFLRATRNFSKQMELHLYGGVVANGKLRVENSTGGLVREDSFDPAPLLGATFIGRF